jgi:hypothetical protein
VRLGATGGVLTVSDIPAEAVQPLPPVTTTEYVPDWVTMAVIDVPVWLRPGPLKA